MSDIARPHTSPAAFRRSVTDRLRRLAVPHGPWSLADLQRQFAYDRLLVRLYLLDDEWIVKGATALLARGIAVRHTIDIDLYRAGDRVHAERDLRAAMAADAGDWMTFEPGPATAVADGVSGLRIPVNARIGAASWARFHVDVVAQGVRMTGRPDQATQLVPVDVPGAARTAYRVYPMVDHVADKVCAIVERHGPMRPSTRFKDLVDLVVLTRHARPTAGEQGRALRSEAARRGLDLPDEFDVPDRALWTSGYAAEARRASGVVAGTLVEALALVRPYLDPVLSGSADGRWDPTALEWRVGDGRPVSRAPV